MVAFGLAAAIANRGQWWRWGAGVILALVCLQSGLVVNQCFYNLQRAGAGASWTDAIFPLREALVRMRPQHVNLMDWGTEFNLLALTRGKMEIHWGAEAGERIVPTENDGRMIDLFLGLNDSVWVKHVEPIEVTPGSEQRFAERAHERGFDKQAVELISDRNGRKIFEIYRFVKVKP